MVGFRHVTCSAERQILTREVTLTSFFFKDRGKNKNLFLLKQERKRKMHGLNQKKGDSSEAVRGCIW